MAFRITSKSVNNIYLLLLQSQIIKGNIIYILFETQSISPGLVKTEMVPEEWSRMDIPMLNPGDVSAAVIYVLGTPPHVQVCIKCLYIFYFIL